MKIDPVCRKKIEERFEAVYYYQNDLTIRFCADSCKIKFDGSTEAKKLLMISSRIE